MNRPSYCESCGAEMSPSAKFCGACGTPGTLRGDQPATVRSAHGPTINHRSGPGNDTPKGGVAGLGDRLPVGAEVRALVELLDAQRFEGVIEILEAVAGELGDGTVTVRESSAFIYSDAQAIVPMIAKVRHDAAAARLPIRVEVTYWSARREAWLPLAEPVAERRLRLELRDQAEVAEFVGLIALVERALGEVVVRDGDFVAFVYATDKGQQQSAYELVQSAAAKVGLPILTDVMHWSQSRREWAAAGEPDLPLGQTIDATAPASKVLVSTTFEIPGCETVAFHGEVFGIVVRSRNIVSNWGARSKAIVGGELRGLTRLLADCRADAVVRLRHAAHDRGANAVIGLRYDTSEIADIANEVVAYGTAVTVRKPPRPASDSHGGADSTVSDAVADRLGQGHQSIG